MIDVPKYFQPVIGIVYPPNNFCEYERWFFENYTGDVREREYLPIFWTAYYVNNNYGKDEVSKLQLQLYLNHLDRTKKYFTIIQYDDSVLNDVSHLDLYQFNMSKPYDYPLPLIGQPHPYQFNEEKKYLANFVGVMTHPIREHAKTLMGKEGYYISFDRHEPKEYCRIIAQSHFTLCYRGYGINSFRISEALQYGSIPVYISDEFIEPHNIPFNVYGIRINEKEINDTERLLKVNEHLYDDALLMGMLSAAHKQLYTYEGARDKILKHLKTI